MVETRFLVSLGMTLAIEVPIVLVMLKFVWRKKNNFWQYLFFAVFASMLTLPYLWFILPPYLDAHYYLYYGEGIVFLVEAVLYWWGLRLKWYEAFSVSFVANLVSYFFGGYLVKLTL